MSHAHTSILHTCCFLPMSAILMRFLAFIDRRIWHLRTQRLLFVWIGAYLAALCAFKPEAFKAFTRTIVTNQTVRVL